MTRQQQKAMWSYLTRLADELNAGGYTVARVCRKPLEISWSKHTMKEIVWDSVMEAMAGAESSTELTNAEFSEIHREVDKAIAERTGVSVPLTWE